MNILKNIIHKLPALIGKVPVMNEKEYLRTKEVNKILGNISPGTLQNLRVKGPLKPSKIEGVYYYKLSEVGS